MLKKLEPVEPTFNSWSDNRPVYQPRSRNFSSSNQTYYGTTSELDRNFSQIHPLQEPGSSSAYHTNSSPFARLRDLNHIQDCLPAIRSDDFFNCKLPPICFSTPFGQINLGNTTSPSTSPTASRSSSYPAMNSKDSSTTPPLDDSQISSNYQCAAGPKLDAQTSLHASESSSSLNAKTACHYMGPCETGAPPRKVVSQIFGRNKICTREIPEDLWPVYCRKHYQRHKYRNAEGFAKTQCDLVLTTVERLDSRCNVRDYTIVLRKKEAAKFKHLQADSIAEDEGLNESSGSSSNNEALHLTSDLSPVPSREPAEYVPCRLRAGGEAEGSSDDNGESTSNEATAPGPSFDPRPFRLSDFAGDGQIGKSSAYVRGVICSIRAAIQAKTLTEFPGIEILPNFGPRNNPANQRKAPPRKRVRRSVFKPQQAAIPGTSIMTMEAASEQDTSPDSSPVRPLRFQGRGFVTRASQREIPRSLSMRPRSLQRGLNPADH